MNLNKELSFDKKMEILDSISDGKNLFEIVAIPKLEGALNITNAMKLFFAQQSGLKSKMVKITLNNSEIKTEAGALYFYCGNITSKAQIGGIGGLFKKSISGGLTGESAIKPLYSGSGEIWLEPSFAHYIFLELHNESIIVDKGMFYACSGSIDVSACSQKNISSAFLGGEGLFQMKLKGTGVVVLESKVPQSEILKYDISEGETLKVDGNFAIARTEGISFTVSKSDKGLIGSALNGEGLLNTFTGHGSVWIAPTSPIYRKLNYGDLPINNSSMNNKE